MSSEDNKTTKQLNWQHDIIKGVSYKFVCISYLVAIAVYLFVDLSSFTAESFINLKVAKN